MDALSDAFNPKKKVYVELYKVYSYKNLKNIINKKSNPLNLSINNENLKQNNYDNLLNINNKKLNLDLSFDNIYKNNEINIKNTRKSILNII